jgi:homoprotocatechuate degradation regulator HpaR
VPPAPPTDHLRAFSRSLPMALLRARESVMARFRPVLRAHGLTEQKWRVLRALSAAPDKLRPIQISQMTYLSMPSLSRLLKSMEAMQLIENSPHASDLRSMELRLTAAGRALVRKVAPHSEKVYGEITGLVGEAELDALYALCERVEARLGAGATPAEEGEA